MVIAKGDMLDDGVFMMVDGVASVHNSHVGQAHPGEPEWVEPQSSRTSASRILPLPAVRMESTAAAAEAEGAGPVVGLLHEGDAFGLARVRGPGCAALAHRVRCHRLPSGALEGGGHGWSAGPSIAGPRGARAGRACQLPHVPGAAHSRRRGRSGWFVGFCWFFFC